MVRQTLDIDPCEATKKVCKIGPNTLGQGSGPITVRPDILTRSQLCQFGEPIFKETCQIMQTGLRIDQDCKGSKYYFQWKVWSLSLTIAYIKRSQEIWLFPRNRRSYSLHLPRRPRSLKFHNQPRLTSSSHWLFQKNYSIVFSQKKRGGSPPDRK